MLKTVSDTGDADRDGEQAPAASQEPKNVLIVGVGGQGVIMVSKVLAQICQEQGYQVKQSEVHGMAKRGGVVFSHVRFGETVWSPTIAKGKADVLIALEWAEGLRWLNYLKPDTGVFIADTRRIVPPFACKQRKKGAVIGYAESTPDEVRDRVGEAYATDATGMAAKAGEGRAANTFLLGALSMALEFPLEDWLEILKATVPPKTVDINVKVFEQGRTWIEKAKSGEHEDEYAPLMGEKTAYFENRLEIIPEWCKSCDICVKMCPEKCLVLNADQVAELTDPDLCTGCRICEWLCPDLAIHVHQTEITEAAQ